MSFEYWYVFPFSIFVATICNASGFSGAVLFQPFFYFVLQIPVSVSIATGIATETIGMSSGTVRYALMKVHDFKNYFTLLPWVIGGVLCGIILFSKLSPAPMKALVGVVMIKVAVIHLLGMKFKNHSSKWSRFITSPIAFIAGLFSASTGTGVAELTQPLSEHGLKMPTKRANANAILLEASADWLITVVNLSLGNLRWDILVFSASGVLIGGQFGALLSPHIPERILKIVFCSAITLIGLFYIYTFAYTG
ncbi:MAG: sulfite exporter TauE/SafE family protein [Bdellovibrionota bacterium]